ncbi:MAG: AGE family epimerase/isomerase [Dysgonamonadaceae bacterium]|jgi:mannobiose 2-epimerase|nr:AGE family epimerase/isomerase [Dysgonamonadaceae bacterium]
MQTLQSKLKDELVENILPYWLTKMKDTENGGFYGRIDGYDRPHLKARKGIVLNARILWTFSAAYRYFNKKNYLDYANRAYDYICDNFIDKENSGVYWEVNSRGFPIDRRKQTYAQGLAIYGFSEYYRATGKIDALENAKGLFRLVEKYALDPVNGGYIEAFSNEWEPIEDMRLSERDLNAPKSMNTHLHILESYSNLLRVWRSPHLIKAQTQLLNLFCERIMDKKSGHLNLFFNREWKPLSKTVSYGHDIEAAWLLFDAAIALNDSEIQKSTIPVSLEIIEAAYEGLQADGSMAYERTSAKHIDKNRHWWVQAETVVGSIYAYILSGDEKYLKTACRCWKYIEEKIIDRKFGEWIWSVSERGKQNRVEDKTGPWKCPCHNARMCLEVLNINTIKYLLESESLWEKFFLAELT